jgi:HD superfamily phosphohydrolase
MYWQVYLHKTAVSAERMVVNIVKRAQLLASAGERVPASEGFSFFLKRRSIGDIAHDRESLEAFGTLDDNDLWGAIKLWRSHPDSILSELSEMILHRAIFHIQLTQSPIKKAEAEKVLQKIQHRYGVLQKEASYYFSHGSVTNEAYISGGQSINILMKNGKLLDIAQASDLPTIQAMSKIVKKNYLCWPKDLSLSN